MNLQNKKNKDDLFQFFLAFKENKTLENLNMSNKNIGEINDMDLVNIFFNNLLKENTNIIKLDISCNLLQYQHLKILTDIVIKTNIFRKLNLSENLLEENIENMDLIIEIINCKSLDFEKRNLSQIGLQRNPCNFKEISIILLNNKSSLSILNISKNFSGSAFTIYGFSEFMQAMGKNETLKILFLKKIALEMMDKNLIIAEAYQKCLRKIVSWKF